MSKSITIRLRDKDILKTRLDVMNNKDIREYLELDIMKTNSVCKVDEYIYTLGMQALTNSVKEGKITDKSSKYSTLNFDLTIREELAKQLETNGYTIEADVIRRETEDKNDLYNQNRICE